MQNRFSIDQSSQNGDSKGIGSQYGSGKDNFKRCESKLQEKLFLLSFDLIELNAFYNYLIYCIFLALDFLFIAYFPLNQIYNDVIDYSTPTDMSNNGSYVQTDKTLLYNKTFATEDKDKYAQQIVQYLNIDHLLDTMNYRAYISMQSKVCHALLVIFFMFIILLLTRERGTINLSSQRKLVTKLFSFVVITLTKTLQVPFLTMMFHVYSCDNDHVIMQDHILEQYCYQGEHMTTVIYTSILLFFFYCMVFYFHKMLSLSYPHEKVPWASLPTSVPILIELIKFVILLVNIETNLSQYVVSYMNLLFALIWLFILYKRLQTALIFHTTVYLIAIASEAMFMVIFLYAGLMDFIRIDRGFVLHILLIGSAVIMAFASIFFREQLRYKFLSRVDFALYENAFEALVMMFTLHELIERSSYDDRQDFILRGFIERHIEICEYPSCSCIKYYNVCNSMYRLELAQMSPFSKNYDSSSMNQTGQNATNMSYTQRAESEVDDLSTLKVFYGRQMSQKKQNKSKAKFLKKFLIDNINVFLDAFPNSVKLHIMAAFIYFSIFKNSFKSLYELSFTKSIKCSYYDQYECFVLSSSITSYFQSRASQGVSNQPAQHEKGKKMKKQKDNTGFSSTNFEVETEIKSVIEFEKVNIQFQKNIELSSIQTKEFWEEILKKNLDVHKIFGLGAKIYKSFIDIKKKYKHLMNLNNNYLEVAYLYKLFVSLILNFEIEVEDAKLEIIKIMQGKSMKKHNLKTEYKSIQLEDENGMIIISGNTQNFTRIQAMNNKAERIFGYSTSDLMDIKLNKLVPKLFAENHENFILNFIKGNRRINKENHNFVWGKHKTGFIVPLIMDINAYVNFQYNFCFIAFLKRSVLLEFKPMRELLEFQDIFVMQTDQYGIIQDMTQNMSEYLNFPYQALNKDISAEAFFKNIFDDEVEGNFMNGKRLEFDPQLIKHILEEEDIDGNDNDSDYGTNFNQSDKKCTAIVWLKSYEYDYQNIKLAYKEIWFVLTDEDASFLDTKNTTEYATAMGDEGPRMHVTYTDDREEICSIASVSSLANYDKNRKNILNKLSEIKTQTVDETKPKQIDLLQKAIVIVFLSIIGIAILVMVVSINRNLGFFSNIDIILQAKQGVIIYSSIRTMFVTLLNIENSNPQFKLNNPVFDDIQTYLREKINKDAENLRVIQQNLEFVPYDYSDDTLGYKQSYAQLMTQRSPTEFENRRITYMFGIEEIINKVHTLTETKMNYTFNSSLLNYDNSNITQFNGLARTNNVNNIYFVVKNSLGSLSNYLYIMSQKYIQDAVSQANNNSSLVLILTIISIAITFMTAFVIMPILHKIERSKERVLMIYTELKKEQIESLNRNIKVFFMKLQQGTTNPGGSLLYQNSSKQFSGKLMTRKFTAMSSRRQQQDEGNDFNFMLRRGAPIGRNEAEGDDQGFGVKKETKEGQSNFQVLFNQPANKKDETEKQNKKDKKRKIIKLGGKKSKEEIKSQRSQQVQVFDNESESDSDDEEGDELSRRRDDEDLSENAEEDKRADLLMTKEEQEHAMFKRLFQSKIRGMTCMKQVKYYIVVIITALVMSGYFTLSYFMVTNIFKNSQESLNILNIVSDRGPFLDSLISYYMQSIDRDSEIFVKSLQDENEIMNSIDYYYTLTQNIEQKYNLLRKNLPSMIEGSKGMIEGLESQDMCTELINDVEILSQNNNKTKLIEECKQVASRVFQLGLTQTLNTMLNNILQGTLQFRNGQTVSKDKQNDLLNLIQVKIKYLNHMDRDLVQQIKESIITYFEGQQQGFVIAFSIFAVSVFIAMILFSYNGVGYLLRNLIAIKFILNFIPGQWLIDNNAAEDLKFIDI